MMYFLAVILIILVILALAWPTLVQNPRQLGRNESALSMLYDQLEELDRDLARNLIGPDDAQAARIEIQRRIIAIGHPDGICERPAASGRAAIFIASIVVPIAAVALYLSLGSPNIPSMPFAERAEEFASIQELETLTSQLRDRLLADADGGPTDGWVLLGETYMRSEQFKDAADAFELLLERPDVTSGIYSRHAEALVMNEGGTVTPKAARAIDRALELDPSNPAATYYKALSLEQSGAPDTAHALLLARLVLAEGYAPWMDSYVGLANFLAASIGAEQISLTDYASVMRQPSDAEVAMAADMAPEDRTAFIASMVDRLATRLESEPNDLAGWLQLAQAYTVLGRLDDATNAYRSAAPLVADLSPDDPRRQQVEQQLAN